MQNDSVPPVSATGWREGLEFARFLAIVLVVWSHRIRFLEREPSWQLLYRQSGLGGILKPGWWGVQIFFALSGYLIGRQAIWTLVDGKTGAALRFTLRRWLRTVPTYWILLAAVCLQRGIPWYSPAVIKNGLFLQTMRPGGNSLLEAAWSLVIEEWSYALVSVLLFGAAFMAWKPSPRRAAIGLLAVAGGLSVVSTAARVLTSDAAWMSWDTLKKVPWLQMDSLAAGMGLASAELLMPNAFRRLAGLGFRNAIVAVLGSFAVSSWANRFAMPGGGPITPRDWAAFGGVAYPIAGLLCCLFLVGLWNLEFTHWPKWISGITRWVAKTSYSLYLVQVPVALLIARLLPDWNGYAVFTVYASAAVGAGIVGWIMLEAPFLRLRAKLRSDD